MSPQVGDIRVRDRVEGSQRELLTLKTALEKSSHTILNCSHAQSVVVIHVLPFRPFSSRHPHVYVH